MTRTATPPTFMVHENMVGAAGGTPLIQLVVRDLNLTNAQLGEQLTFNLSGAPAGMFIISVALPTPRANRSSPSHWREARPFRPGRR